MLLSVCGGKVSHMDERYHTAGFVCKILIYPNYTRCYGLADFNSTVTLIATFVSTQ